MLTAPWLRRSLGPCVRRPRVWTACFSSDAVDVLPPHIKFRMPDLAFGEILGGDQSTTLAKWHVQEGARIDEGGHMCAIDAPDLSFVLDCGDEGYIAKICTYSYKQWFIRIEQNS